MDIKHQDGASVSASYPHRHHIGITHTHAPTLSSPIFAIQATWDSSLRYVTLRYGMNLGFLCWKDGCSMDWTDWIGLDWNGMAELVG